jgi:hypothetical protein
LGLLDRATKPATDAGAVNVALTTSVEQVVAVGQVPFLLITEALELYARRRQSPYTGLPTTSTAS